MGRKRIHDKHLPKRVVQKHGAYYYIDKNQNNKWIPLGNTAQEMAEKWVKLTFDTSKIRTMNDIFDKYLVEVSPKKAANTFKSEVSFMKWLRLFFGEMHPEFVTPVNIYAFQDLRGKKTKVSANREIALLSDVFNKAIRWGLVKINPCNDIEKFTEKPRKRSPSHEEFEDFKNFSMEPLKSYMWLKYLTGQRPNDVVKIKITEIHDLGIDFDQSKTGVELTVGWKEECKKCVDYLLSERAKSNVKHIYLFSNKEGDPLTYAAIATMFKRTMRAAIQFKIIKERFQLRDLRRKNANDSDSLEEASSRLGHTTTKVTLRHYRNKRREVDALK